MSFDIELRKEILEVNKSLSTSGLARLTWGNASGYDEVSGLVAIKPSGVAYDAMRVEDLVIVDLDGCVVEGDLNPSTDLKTHLEIYRGFEGVRGVVHTHSLKATAFAQAGMGLACYGTTHADYFNGEVPCVPALSEAEVAEDYEGNTGVSIVRFFEEKGIDPLQVPAALLRHHAPFVWGRSPRKALENSIVLELCAEMALDTRLLDAGVGAIPDYVLGKHQERKHGDGAYYGQGGR